jgi:two-component system phosphate regulon sensor histidine kinase PhoR
MRRRVLILLMAVALLTEALLGGGMYAFARAAMVDQAATRMEDVAELLLNSLPEADLQAAVDGWAAALNEDGGGYRVTVVDAGGEVLADSGAAAGEMENHLEREEVQEALHGGRGRALRDSATTGQPQLYVAVTDGSRVLRLSQDFDQIRSLWRTLLLMLCGTALVTLAAAWLLSIAASRRVLRPIEALRQGAGRIAEGDLNYRIPAQPDEMGALAGDFNEMAEKLARSLRHERTQRAQMQAVLRAIPAGLIAVDRVGLVSQINPEAVRLLGLRGGRVGENFVELMRDSQLIDLARKTLTEDSGKSAEWTTDRVLRAVSAPIRDEGGEAIGVVLIISDMTQMRRLEQLRSEFVSNATHELKTPLTAIRGCIETLRDPEVDTSNPEILSEMLEIMDAQGERLQALISDMLELSRIESAPALADERGDLCAAVREAATAVGVQAGKAEVALHVSAEGELFCSAAEERLRRIAQNLLENAVRYNRPGGNVWATVRREGAKAVLSVRDDGVGIPEKDLPRVCERFYRVDKDRSRNSGGTGLGLAIVKHLVRRYDGELDIRSKLGEGSTFTVRIPIQRPKRSAAADAAPPEA